MVIMITELLAAMLVHRSPPDGFLTSGQSKHELELDYLDLLSTTTGPFTREDNVLYLTKAEEINIMSTGEDEASPNLNGRLRPRKSTIYHTASPQNKTVRRTEPKLVTERPKRSSTSSKVPSTQDDLNPKSDTLPAPLLLCPFCDRKFNTRQTASKHARRIHLSTAKQDNFIKCLFCNHSDADSNSIIKHMVDSHPNQYFACLDCHTRFPSTTELAEHKLNVCEKQKPSYRSKLRQKSTTRIKKISQKAKNEKSGEANENTQLTEDLAFNGIVISCELKPSDAHDTVDIEDKITTNLILPSAKASLGSAGLDKNGVFVLEDLQWNKRIPQNFSFHNTDADQILSRLGVVHRSPRVGESKKDLIRIMDQPNEKFEKCFDTSFYTRVAKNVQENLTKYLDGTFNFNPNRDSTFKTRKSKSSVVINTAEGFPILLAEEQYSRQLFDGYMPRAIAPKHKWKWDVTENDKNLMLLLDQTKRDNHVDKCIITLISGLDIWTQLRMKSKFEEINISNPTAKKTEKQNVISMELKEILESRDIPSTSSQVVQFKRNPVEPEQNMELPTYLGLSATRSECALQPAVLSGEWVRPRCYVCCACGEHTREARTLTSHLSTQHPNAQVQYYEIVGETLLSADILKHLYVPPSQMSNRTRPPRGFRDCTKCNKSITLEDLHQHMLDCAGDTPTVRRKCRYRPFGVRRRRTRLPDNTVRKKIRKDMRARHRQQSHMRPRPRIRTEVGDAETIRRMIADLPAKRNRITPANVLRPRRTIIKAKKQVKLRSSENKKQIVKILDKSNKTQSDATNSKQNETDYLSTLDEDDRPLKFSATRIATRSGNRKKVLKRRVVVGKNKRQIPTTKQKRLKWVQPISNRSLTSDSSDHLVSTVMYQNIVTNVLPPPPPPPPPPPESPAHEVAAGNNIVRPEAMWPEVYPPHYHPYYYPNQMNLIQESHLEYGVREMRRRKTRGEYEQIQYQRAALEYFDGRIDLTNAGAINVRQHSGRNGNNIRNSRDYPPTGGESSHHNNNVAQVPDVPLKHSIASLTSGCDDRDSMMLRQQAYMFTSDLSQSYVHDSSDRRKFENEAMVKKLDKPPLAASFAQSCVSMDQSIDLNNYKGVRDSSYGHQYSYIAEARDSDIPSHLSNESTELRASVGTYMTPRDYSMNDSNRMNLEPLNLLGNNKVSDDVMGDMSMLKKDVDMQCNNTFTMTETDRPKSGKTRKGLKIENCIAMIRTKKGLGLDKTNENENNKDQESHAKNSEMANPNLVMKTSKDQPAVTPIIGDFNEKEPEMRNIPTSENCSQANIICTSGSSDQLISKSDNIQNNICNERNEVTAGSAEIEITRHQRNNSETPNKQDLFDNFWRVGPPKPGSWGELLLYVSELSNFWQSQLGEEYNDPVTRERYATTTAKKAMQLLIDMDIPGVSKTITALQENMSKTGKEFNMRMLYEYTYHILYKTYQVQIPVENDFLNDIAKAHAYAADYRAWCDASKGRVDQPTYDTENITEETFSMEQCNDYAVSRRTRRKPIKKKSNSETETQIIQGQNVIAKKIASSTHQTLRGSMATTLPGTSAIVKSNYLTLPVSSSESMHSKTPPLPPYSPNTISKRRDSTKPLISNSASPVKEISRSSPRDAQSETIQQQFIMNNLRRQSIEMVNAQNQLHNYAAQVYRMEYEKAMLGVPYSEPQTQLQQLSRDDRYIESYKQSSDAQVNRYSAPAMSPMDQKAKALSNKSVTAEDRGNRNPSRGSNHKLPFNNFDSTEISISMQRAEQDFIRSSQVSGPLDNKLHVPHRRNSEAFFPRSSLPNENIEKPDNSSRIYHEPVALFAPPSTVRVNPQLSRELNADEIPLDLSCVTRKESIVEENIEATDLSKTSFIQQATNDKHNDGMVYSKYHSQTEPFRNLQYGNFSDNTAKLCEPNADMSRRPSPVTQVDKAQISTSTYSPDMYLKNQTAQCNAMNRSENTDKSDLNISKHVNEVEYHVNTQRNMTQRSRSLSSSSSVGHSFVHRETLTSDKNEIQEIFQEPQNIARTDVHDKAKARFDSLKNPNSDSTGSNVFGSSFEKTIPNSSQLRVSKYLTHASDSPDAVNNSMREMQSCSTMTSPNRYQSTAQFDTQVQEYDTNQIEQDPEARKFALLPEELAKILGAIPKDHRKDLLNVLPQYVSTSVTKLEHDVKSSTPKVSTTNPNNFTETNQTYDQQMCTEYNRLTVNTAISPSSVIPKKRHSPSQTRARGNSSDFHSGVSFLPPPVPALTQRCSMSYHETGKNPNISPNYVRVGSNISEVETTNNFNATDSTNFNLNNESFGSLLHHTARTQLLPPQLPTKQKPGNEQTSSLRAVRIKTTSARKSMSDDKIILTENSYKSNSSADDKSLNVEINVNVSADVSNLSSNGTYASQSLCTSTNMISTENACSDKVTIATNIIYEDENKITTNKQNDGIVVGAEAITENDYSGDGITLLASLVTASDRQSVIENQLRKDLMLTDTNDEIQALENFAEKSQNCRENTKDQEVMSVEADSQASSCESENKNQQNDINIVEPLNISEEISSNIFSEVKDAQFTLDADQLMHDQLQYQKNIGDNELVVKESARNSEDNKYDKKSNEEDSDDDIALAFIKKKKSTDSNNSVSDKNKKHVSKRDKGKHKRHHQKKKSKHHKKKTAKDSRLSDKALIICDTTEGNHRKEMKINTPMLDSNTAADADKQNMKITSCDVNEENTMRVGENTKIVKETNRNVRFEIDSQGECSQALDLARSNRLEISAINSSRSENDVLDDIEEAESNKGSKNIASSSLTASVHDHSRLSELAEISLRDSAETSPRNNDIQMPAEDLEQNQMPLRRSRRGKSMFTDSAYLARKERREEYLKRAPLTMKRLILSRVEKDNKRNKESIAIDVQSEFVEDRILSEETKATTSKKGKVVKRKKSPHVKKTSKKSKPSHVCEIDDELSELANATSDKITPILRELPNAENKITNRECYKKDVKCCATTEDKGNVSENSTSLNEKATDVTSDKLVDDKIATGKRKLSVTIVSDLVSSKLKKTKCDSRNSQSDFESNDDKNVQDIKPAESVEYLQNADTNKVDGTEKVLSSVFIKVSDGVSNNEANTTTFNESGNVSAPTETRTTCYSRPISNRRQRSSSVTIKSQANYDPYDIDFDDLIETTHPVKKKKTKNTPSTKVHNEQKVSKTVDSAVAKKSEQASIELLNVNHESDSDSSKSDVPLQKYVEEKALELDAKTKITNNKVEICIENEESMQQIQNKLKAINEPKEDILTNNDANDESSPSDNYTKQSTDDEKTCKIDVTCTAEQNKHKHGSKHKKSRRTPTTSNNDTVTATNEVEQQMHDKFMENFGFYSERIPRKSNLLATKKISETFHMISNENDYGFSDYKEKTPRKTTPSESKKKLEATTTERLCDTVSIEDVQSTISTLVEDSKFCVKDDQSTDLRADMEESVIVKEPDDTPRMDDSDLDSLTAQAIMDSEEVRNLENDLFSGLREAAEAANAARKCFIDYHQNTCDLDAIAKNNEPSAPILQAEQVCEPTQPIKKLPKKSSKNKKIKQPQEPGVKYKMYPEMEEIEIDMFEDKFDIIKRKRRSQAVAAKQVQSTIEANTSSKSRKQSEKKKHAKNSKKSYQSSQVPTKGALKGFESIKISIPTQDLNLPSNVSPPRQSKKRRKTASKRRKDSSEFESIASDVDDRDKFSERDIYEFKESEDAELFDLRPSTVMDRFRSLHNKNKSKYKDKDRSKDNEKEKVKNRNKHKKDSTRSHKKSHHKTANEHTKRSKKISNEETRRAEKNIESVPDCSEKNRKASDSPKSSLEPSSDQNYKNSQTDKPRSDDYDKKDSDNVVAGSSGFVPDRMDDSEYESECSADWHFLFNCVCTSGNDSDDSDMEKDCGRYNCVNKTKNADKNAAIGNIFKNNAVRCEKSELKEPDKPKINLDQLFDSLLETDTKPNTDKIDDKKDGIKPKLSCETDLKTNLGTTTSFDKHIELFNKSIRKESTFEQNSNKKNVHHSTAFKPRHDRRTSKDDVPTSSKSHVSKFLSQADTLSDSDSMQIFTVTDKSKSNLGYSLMSEECTQVNLEDIIAEGNNRASDRSEKIGPRNRLSNSEDEFDVDKPESLNRQYMHLVLPAEKASTCAQTDSRLDDSADESANESAPARYLKGLTPAEAENVEIYTMVSAQGTQTDKTHRRDSAASSRSEVDTGDAPRSRIRLQKYDVREVAQKTKSTKSIQTEKERSDRNRDHRVRSDSDNDVDPPRGKAGKRSEHSRVGRSGGIKSARAAALDDARAFTAPASRERRVAARDEGPSRGRGGRSPETAGVAPQRARRKCTVGKQNVLAEHWSSESEFDSARPDSADSGGAARRKRGRRREAATARRARPPPGPKMRARAATHYWSSEGEDAGTQPQHGWIVGDSHKKLVTMLAHAKGRKRSHADDNME